MNFGRYLRRDTVFPACTVVGGSLTILMYCRHGFAGEILSKYNTVRGPDGERVSVRATLKVQLEEVLTDIGYNEWQRKFFKLFICGGFEPMVYGSTKIRDGVHIGVPEYLQAINEDEIKQSHITIDGKPIDWDSPDGEKLLESLKLSENGVKFLLAKQSLLADNYRFITVSVLPLFMFTGFYAVAERAHSFFNLLNKPLLNSIYVHSGIGAVFIFLFLFMYDGINMSYEKASEEKMYKIQETYILGGIEYYQKRIQRNKALRNLMKRGESRYSVGGNEISIFRSGGLPDTFKLKIAKDTLRKYYEKKDAAEIPTPRKPQPIY